MKSQPKKENGIERLVRRFDTFQQRHTSLAFPYAVIKKYGDDEAGYQAALLAYYGFLSLFPLLIVTTAVIQRLSANDARLRQQFLDGVMSYFPALGDNLVASLNTPSKTGFALAIGLLLTFYGAKGVADAVQHALNHVWAVARPRRVGFPKATLRSFGILLFAGFGFLVAAGLNSYASASDHALFVRFVLGTGGFVALFGVFWGVFTFGSSARKRPVANIPGALFAAVGFLVLQSIGGYLVTQQLRSQTGLNAQFAVVLALLFWIYLQAKVFLYAVEINTVRVHKLWPRSVSPKPPLPADEKAYDLYRKRETFVDDEPVKH